MIQASLRITLLLLMLFLAVPCDGQEIATHVKNLGSSSFAEREKASQELETVGEPALVELRKALKSEDAEIRKRAEELIVKIEANTRNRKLTQPTQVSLDFQDAPVSEVVAELVKQSGFRVILQDRKGNLATRKITLKVSKVSFWEAMEAVCEKAGLVEIAVPLTSSLVPGLDDGLPGGVIPPMRIQPANPKVNPPGGKDAENKKILQEKPALKKGFEQGREIQPVAPQGIGALPPPPGGNRGLPGNLDQGGAPNRTGVIILREGKRQPRAMDARSAYRIKVMESPEAFFGAPPVERQLIGLEVTPEPRLKLKGVVSARIEKALDADGKNLENDASVSIKKEIAKPQPGRVIARAMPIPGIKDASSPAWENKVPVYLITGAKPVKSIVTLEGVLTLQVYDEVQALLETNGSDIKPGGKIEGKKGGWLKVHEWAKLENGYWKIRFEWDIPEDLVTSGLEDPVAAQIIIPGNVPGLNPQIQIQQFGMAIGGKSGMNANGFEVLDKAGKPLTAISQGSRFQQNPGGIIMREMTLQFAPKGPEPATLRFKGRKTHTVEIPFALKNIALEDPAR